MNPEDIEYEPAGVKAVLTKIKGTAELLIDLSYSVVLHANDDLAVEVLNLEGRMNTLQLQARMNLVMAAHNPEDVEELAPVLDVIGATEKISDATGDIAKVVIEDISLPDAIHAALPEAVETTIWCKLTDGSPYADRNLGGTGIETKTSIRVVATHHAGEWVANPDHEAMLRAGDVPLFHGRGDGLHTVHEAATNLRYDPPDVSEPTIEDLERVIDSIVLMRDMSKLAVSLAYDAMLFDSENVAEEVEELEAEVGALKSRFEAWTLHATSRVEDPVSLHGLVQLAGTAEMISGATLEIAEDVLHDTGAHPVVAAVVKESDKIIIHLRVVPASDLAEAALGDRHIKSKVGIRVITVRQAGGRGWVVSPGLETRLHGGNLTIAKGTRASAGRLDELVSDEYEFDK